MYDVVWKISHLPCWSLGRITARYVHCICSIGMYGVSNPKRFGPNSSIPRGVRQFGGDGKPMTITSRPFSKSGFETAFADSLTTIVIKSGQVTENFPSRHETRFSFL